jgi:biopolymer transport protein ExbB
MPAGTPQNADGSFFLYFGNPQAPRGDDAGGTWDVNTVAALHFNQTAGLPVDSTAYATPVRSGQIFPNPASLIGNGATLSGSEPLVLGPAPQLAPSAASGWTFETWIRLNGLPTQPVYLLDVPGTAGPGLSITLSETGLTARLGTAEVSSFTPLNASNWHHVALVLNTEGLQLFLDGKQVGGAPAPAATLGDTVYVGGAAAVSYTHLTLPTKA